MGHNELDEPSFTQPRMYRKIRGLETVPEKYQKYLIASGVLTADEVKKQASDYFGVLEEKLAQSYNHVPTLEAFKGKWSKMVPTLHSIISPPTGVPIETLAKIGKASVALHGVKVHPRIQKYHIDQRLLKLETPSAGLDWATCEALAFGSLLLEGFDVRISGQDVGRGTFSQRHAMFVDSESERTIIPLNLLDKGIKGFKVADSKAVLDESGAEGLKVVAKLEIANSNLSEYAVMGFEYGQSWETPNRLVIWEAQFGDFFNGAQIVIDVYLSSGETKWMRQSGLVLLLPHGYDGAGPEHSSCRIERFLQLCNEPFQVDQTDNDIKTLAKTENCNMQVVNPSTPAQYFHVLRRQMLRNYRKPLIVVAPKGLLRSPVCTSTIEEMGAGKSWQPVLPDPLHLIQTSNVLGRMAFVSGKLYYELVKKRHELELDAKIAIVRIEELSPFPQPQLSALIAQFPAIKDFVWVQEEPQNQGAWSFVSPRLEALLGKDVCLRYVGRLAAAAPATGFSDQHKAQVQDIFNKVFQQGL